MNLSDVFSVFGGKMKIKQKIQRITVPFHTQEVANDNGMPHLSLSQRFPDYESRVAKKEVGQPAMTEGFSSINRKLHSLEVALYTPAFVRLSQELCDLVAARSLSDVEAVLIKHVLNRICEKGLEGYERFKLGCKEEAIALHAEGKSYDHLMKAVIEKKYCFLNTQRRLRSLACSSENEPEPISWRDLMEQDFEDFRFEIPILRTVRWKVIAWCSLLIDIERFDEAITASRDLIEKLNVLSSSWDPAQRSGLSAAAIKSLPIVQETLQTALLAYQLANILKTQGKAISQPVYA